MQPWRGVTLWGEAGWSFSYLHKKTVAPITGAASRIRARSARGIGAESSGLFGETNADGVFVSRFDNDFLVYSQNKFGWTLAPTADADSLELEPDDGCAPLGMGQHDRARPRPSLPRARNAEIGAVFGECASGQLHRHER